MSKRKIIWTKNDIGCILNLYPNGPKNVIQSTIPDKSWKEIRVKAIEMGIKRNKDLIREEKFGGRGNLVTFRKFCSINDIEPQAGMVYRKLGLIKEHIEYRGKRTFIFIDKNDIRNLKEDEHYIICPKCRRKIIALHGAHSKKCGIQPDNKYARIFYDSHKKSDSQKIHQAQMMNEHYLTPDGDITKSRVSAATLKRLSDKNYREKQINSLINFNKSDKGREIKKVLTKEYWTREDYRNKILKYISDNKEKVDKSIAFARGSNFKKSWVSFDLYVLLKKIGMDWLEFGFPYYFYELDIADTLYGVDIEIDGCYWHGCPQCGFKGRDNVKSSDKRKDSFLTKKGWIVVRLKEHELMSGLEGCIAKIQGALNQAKIRPFIFRDSVIPPNIRLESLIKSVSMHFEYCRRLSEKGKEWNTIKPKNSLLKTKLFIL
jgi:ribosomal protein L28